MRCAIKKCSHCGLEKPLLDFFRGKGSKDGRRAQCKVCSKRYTITEERKVYERKYGRVYDKSPIGKYRTLKSSAKKRGVELSISLEEYTNLLNNGKCHYADCSLEGLQGSSLNRIDNSKGYSIDNVKLCCGICNFIMNKFTKEQLKKRLLKIYKRL